MPTNPDHCPACDRPPANDDHDDRVCALWWSVRNFAGVSQHRFTECFKHARDWRAQTIAAETIIEDLKIRLRAAQDALTRHHEAAHRDAGTFRSGARIT